MDFLKLRYRVDLVPLKEKVVNHFPILADHQEFSNPNNDILLRICFLATDENSPFVRLERDDYDKRLLKIFEYLKIKDSKLLEAISTGVNVDFEQMVTKFMMQCDALAYAMWYDKLRMFHYIGIALRKPITMDEDLGKRVNLDKQREAVYNTLLDYEAQIFSDIPTRMKVRKQVAKLLQPAEQYAVPKQVV